MNLHGVYSTSTQILPFLKIFSHNWVSGGNLTCLWNGFVPFLGYQVTPPPGSWVACFLQHPVVFVCNGVLCISFCRFLQDDAFLDSQQKGQSKQFVGSLRFTVFLYCINQCLLPQVLNCFIYIFEFFKDIFTSLLVTANISPQKMVKFSNVLCIGILEETDIFRSFSYEGNRNFRFPSISPRNLSVAPTFPCENHWEI